MYLRRCLLCEMGRWYHQLGIENISKQVADALQYGYWPPKEED